VALSALGYAVAALSAWLGGHLSFSRGVGVNQTAFEDPPEQWTAVLGEDGLEEGKLTGAQADGVTGCWCAKKGASTGSSTAAHTAAARCTRAS
jgi:hypothetical protein